MKTAALLTLACLSCGGIALPTPQPEPEPVDAGADSVTMTPPDAAPKRIVCRIVFNSTIVDRICASLDGGPSWTWRDTPGNEPDGWIGCELALCKPGDRCKLFVSGAEAIGVCASTD